MKDFCRFMAFSSWPSTVVLSLEKSKCFMSLLCKLVDHFDFVILVIQKIGRENPCSWFGSVVTDHAITLILFYCDASTGCLKCEILVMCVQLVRWYLNTQLSSAQLKPFQRGVLRGKRSPRFTSVSNQ